MKRNLKFIPVLCSIAIMFASCGHNKTKEGSNEGSEKNASLSDMANGISNLDNLNDGTKKMEALQAKLKAEKPLTAEELKAFLPESFAGLKRTSYSAGSTFGAQVTSGNATYTADDQKSIEISIVDGAGETASAVVSLAQLGFMMDTENITETEVDKTGMFEGKRAKTVDHKGAEGTSEKSSEISYLEKDRYLITLRGTGYSLDELKSYMGKLNVAALQ